MGDIIPNLICSSLVQKSVLQRQNPVFLYQTLVLVLPHVPGLLTGPGAALALLSPASALDTQLAPRRDPISSVGGYDGITDIAGGSRVVTVFWEGLLVGIGRGWSRKIPYPRLTIWCSP